MPLTECGIFLASSGPTKSITRFDRLDCGPSSSSSSDTAGSVARNLIFIPTCVSACARAVAGDAEDAELKEALLPLPRSPSRGEGPGDPRSVADGRSTTLPSNFGWDFCHSNFGAAFCSCVGPRVAFRPIQRLPSRRLPVPAARAHRDRFSEKCVSATY